MKSPSSRWTCTIVTVALALGACAPVPEPGPAPAPGPGFFDGVPLPNMPLGQLSQVALSNLANQVTWEGCTWAARTAATATPTPPPTVIQICAASYSRRLRHGNTANTGVITARMVNLGANKDARWGLNPGETSYIISFPRTASEGAYAILEVKANPAPGEKVRIVRADGTYRYCRHGGEPPVSEASFYTCEQKTEMHRRSRSSDAGSGPNAAGDDDLLVPAMDGPAWVSCNAGCCTTEAS